MKQYCEDLRAYNRVHRLIGNVSCETLLMESMSAIENSMDELRGYTTMLDVGAGAGVLGQAWLDLSPTNHAVFLESDKKAVAFLHSFYGGNKRARVVGSSLEDLSLEEVAEINLVMGKLFFSSRAFSSHKRTSNGATASLEEIYKGTRMPFPLYNFEKKDNSFYLIKKC